MKKKTKLTPILLALILSLGASLTSCEDSEAGTDSSSVTVSQTEKETNADTAAETDSVTSEAPTDSVITETPAEDTEQAPDDGKKYASKEEYLDDWGISDGIMRAKGDTYFWEKSRVMHTAPKGIPGPENWFITHFDEKNDSFMFHIFKNDYNNEKDYYSMVKGKIYKLNEGKIIFQWYDGTGPFYWIEEDGTAKSFYVRSKDFSKVYIEAEGVKNMIDVNPLSFRTMNGEKIGAIKEKILAEIKEIK